MAKRGRKPFGQKTSKYIGVYRYVKRSGTMSEPSCAEVHQWAVCINLPHKKVFKSGFTTEREAALAYDKYVLEHGLARPLNILKPKA